MNRGFFTTCFVPSCGNTTYNSKDKVFVHVPKTLKLKWCRQLGVAYKPRLYCCEDHLNLEEDLENYYYWKLMNGFPKLKSTAKLWLESVNDENAFPSTSMDVCGTFETASPSLESPVLRELLLNPNIEKPQTSREQRLHTMKPTCTFTSTHPTKVDAATQCCIEHVDKSTCTQKQRKDLQESDRPSPVPSNDSVNVSESPSMYGATTATSETETVSNNKELVYRNKMLEAIKSKPKSYIGLPKQYFWLIHHIAVQSKVKELDIIITLLKIKQNDTVFRICDQFQISKGKFTKLFHLSIEALGNFFQNLIYMPTPLQIRQNLPLVFKIRYSNVQLILDAFEIEIEKPHSPMQQAQTWSQYKSCNTVKYLIRCTPNGFVAFISKGYGGRISDKALVYKSDLIECLPNNAVIMADRGFKEIESLLIAKNITLLRPPSVFANIKPTKQEVIQTKVIASLRVHIERVIRRIREFRLLNHSSAATQICVQLSMGHLYVAFREGSSGVKPHSVVHNKHVVYLDHMVLIACGLINLQSEIIKRK